MTSAADFWPRDVFLLKLMNTQVQKIQEFPNTHRHKIFGDRMNIKELTPSLFLKKRILRLRGNLLAKVSYKKWGSLSPPSPSPASLCPVLPPLRLIFRELDFRKDFTELDEILEMNPSNLFIFEDEEMEVQTREGRCIRSPHHRLVAGLR